MSENNHLAETWSSALSAALGQSIALDDAGGCVLEFEGDIHIVVEPVPGTGLLCMRAAVSFPGCPVAPEAM